MKYLPLAISISTALSFSFCAHGVTSNNYRFYAGKGLPQIEANSISETSEDPILTLVMEVSDFPSSVNSALVAKRGNEIIAMASCLDYINAGLGAGQDGVYQITNSGYTYPVFCNQTSFGGGFTLVVAQYEDSPVDWTGSRNGIQSGYYDASLEQNTGFSLSSAQIPPHSSTGFSYEGVDGTSVPHYINFNYTTGDISIAGQDIYDENGTQYHVSRNAVYHYAHHDPDDYGGSSGIDWRNTLTIDRAGMRGRDWAFGPYNPTIVKRGYSYNGVAISESYQALGFFIWVR